MFSRLITVSIKTEIVSFVLFFSPLDDASNNKNWDKARLWANLNVKQTMATSCSVITMTLQDLVKLSLRFQNNYFDIQSHTVL